MAENTQYILLARFLEHIAPEARADACRELVGEFIARKKAYRCYEILADPTGFWGPGPREPAYPELPDDYWRFGKISLPSSTLTFAGRNFFVEVLLDEPTSQTPEAKSDSENCSTIGRPPYEEARKVVDENPFKTGAPGRPTPISVIEVEAKRQVNDGEVIPREKELTKLAESLATWWNDTQRATYRPPRPKMTAGAIANALRSWWQTLPKKND